MITEADFFGGANATSISTGSANALLKKRIQLFVTSSSGDQVVLPPTNTRFLKLGGMLLIINSSTSPHSLTIISSAGAGAYALVYDEFGTPYQWYPESSLSVEVAPGEVARCRVMGSNVWAITVHTL